MTNRLKTEIWIQAQIRRCFIENTPAFVVSRGDVERGGVLLKVNHFEHGCEVLQPTTDMNGGRVWMRLTGDVMVNEHDADDIISKRHQYDMDLWVVEIEDSNGHFNIEHFLDEPVD
jgi:hypothetical protein